MVAKVKRAVTERLSGVAAAQCYVCDRILHTLKVKRFDPTRYRPSKQKGKEEVTKEQVLENLEKLVTKPGHHDMCSTCFTYIRKAEIPRMSVFNGFWYPKVPAHLPELTQVAEHILALRIPFQQITNLGRMGRRGQWGLRGSVVNIPTDPNQTVQKVIPLMTNDESNENDQVYVVNLVRKMVHQRPYASSYVSKEALLEWGTYLTGTELYKEYGVQFQPYRGLETDRVPEPAPDDPENNPFDGQAQDSILMPEVLPVTAAPVDTTEDIVIAPGENMDPLSVVRDRQAEELSFPSVYLGQRRKFKIPAQRFVVMKSEVSRVDRRGARPRALLYKYAVHCREQAARRLRHR